MARSAPNDSTRTRDGIDVKRSNIDATDGPAGADAVHTGKPPARTDDALTIAVTMPAPADPDNPLPVTGGVHNGIRGAVGALPVNGFVATKGTDLPARPADTDSTVPDPTVPGATPAPTSDGTPTPAPASDGTPTTPPEIVDAAPAVPGAGGSTDAAVVPGAVADAPDPDPDTSPDAPAEGEACVDDGEVTAADGSAAGTAPDA